MKMGLLTERKLVKFNKIIFDKKLSPAKKWALVEGLAMFLNSDEQLHHFMSSAHLAIVTHRS
jgi:hypothetical protein